MEDLISEEPPSLTIELILAQNTLMFVPPLDMSFNKKCLDETLNDWFEACFQASRHVVFISSSSEDESDFDSWLKVDAEICECLNTIWSVVKISVSNCQQIVPVFEGYSGLWEHDAATVFEEFLKQAKENAMNNDNKTSSRGHTKDSFLETTSNDNRNIDSQGDQRLEGHNPLSREMTSHSETKTVASLTRHRLAGGNNILAPGLPTLDDFDVEMAKYKSMVDELNEMPDYHDCGFIRLDIRPIRDSLIVLASKSIYVYARYLINKTTAFVDDLRVFLDEVEVKIDQLNENDFKSYKVLMHLVNEIQRKQMEVESKIPVLQRAVSMIQRYGHSLPGNYQTLFSTSPSRWNAVKTKVNQTKQRLAPKIQNHIGKVIDELKEFNTLLSDIWSAIENADLYSENGDSQFIIAFDTIDNFGSQISNIEDTAQDLKELQNFVETSVVDFDLIPKAKKRLQLLERTWKCVEAFAEKYKEWCHQQWIKTNFSKLREEVTAEIKRMQMLPVEAREWQLVQSSENEAKKVEQYVPLLESVSNPAMRARHWKQLLRAINSTAFMDSDSIKTATFGQMLGLRLHNNSGDVYLIVQRAVKDLKIEKSLKTLEEIWFGKLFTLRPRTILRPATRSSSSEARRRGTMTAGDSAKGGMTVDITVDDRSEGVETKLGYTSASTNQFSNVTSAKTNAEETNANSGVLTSVIILQFEKLYEEIESHQLQLQSILHDPQASSFIDDVTKWQQNLQHVESVLRQWQRVQNMFIQMQEIFASDEVRVALAHENHKFMVVSKEFLGHMRQVERNPNIFQNCNRPNMLDRLESMGDVMNGFVKTLLNYVVRVQIEFPRLLLFSPLDCLRIISSAMNPELLNSIIYKFMPSAKGLKLSEDEQQILGLIGHLEDELIFDFPIACQEITQVLGDLQSHTATTLKSLVPMGLKMFDPESQRFKGLYSLPIDILITVLRIKLTSLLGDGSIENRNAFKTALDELVKTSCNLLKSSSIQDYIEATKNITEDNPTLFVLPPSEMVKIQSIISLAISYREMLFSEPNSGEQGAFEFETFPKVVFDQSKNSVEIKAMGTSIDYAFEFIGASSFHETSFIQSPFTYASVFRSFQTQTPTCFISDNILLAKKCVEFMFGLFGRMLFSFSLGDGTNLASQAENTPNRLSEIVQATILSGAWVLFSDLHNLTADMQLLTVASVNDQVAQTRPEEGGASSAPNIIGSVFFTADSSLSIEAGTISNSHPISEAVRSNLRTVSLEQPNLLVQTETYLLREGFSSVHDLSKSVINYLHYASKLLGTSETTHTQYESRILDLGTHTLSSPALLKAICRSAGEHLAKLNQKKAMMYDEELEATPVEGDGEEFEELAIVSALEAVLLGQLERENSELLVAITPLFFRLSPDDYVKSANARSSSRMIPSRKSARPINVRTMTNSFGRTSDSFFSTLDLKIPVIDPSLTRDRVCDGFHEAVFSAARRLNFNIELTGHLLEKLDQLYEMFHQYSFVTILGEACSGKTDAFKLFCASMKQMGTQLNFHTIFPASVETTKIFGDSTRLAKHELGNQNGLIPAAFDLLSQIKGNGINHVLQVDGPLTPNVVERLQDMIYSDDISNLVDGRKVDIARQNCHVFWETDTIANLSPAICARMALVSITREKSVTALILFHWIQRKPYDFQRLFFGLFSSVFVPAINKRAELCQHTCWPMSNDLQIVTAVMNFMKLFDALLHALEIRREELFKRSTYFCIYWAFAGSLTEQMRQSFLQWLIDSFSDCPRDLDMLIPDSEKDDFIKIEPSHLGNLPQGIGIHAESFIRTKRTDQLSYFVSLICEMGESIAVVGRDGCGKTKTLMTKLDQMCASQLSDYDSAIVTSNRQTDSLAIYSALDRHVAWRHGQTYAPKAKRLICFIDDLHMAKFENDTRAQTAAELVRQHIDDGGFNSPATCSWRYIKGTSYIISLNPTPRSSQPYVSERLLWKFFFINLAYPDQDEQKHIFSGFLQAHFANCGSTLRNSINDLVSLTLDLVSDMEKVFVPTLTRGHYVFSMHDVARIFTFFCQSMNTEIATGNISNLFYLWRHEVDWNLKHKLNSSIDQQKYDEIYTSRVKKYISDKRYLEWMFEEETPLFSSIITHENGMTNVAIPQQAQIGSGYRTYVLHDFYKHEESMDEDIFELSFEAQNEWNKNFPNIEIFFYRQILAVVSRIARTVASSSPHGNVVLVADGYPGRTQFFATLGGSVAGLQIRTLPPALPHCSDDEKTKEALAALADFFFEAGCKEQKMLIIIHDEEFLNSPLLLAKLIDFVATADLISLFSPDVVTNIINAVRTDASAVGQAHSKHAIWRFFERRVFENARLCIIFNKVDANFWPIVRDYIQLFKQSNVIWLSHWSRSQLVTHADYHFRTEEDEDDDNDDEEEVDEWEWVSETDRENICHLLADMHLTIRTQAANAAKTNAKLYSGPYGNLTNTTFEYFVRRFLSMLLEEREKILSEEATANQVIERLQRDSDAATQLGRQLEIDLQIAKDKRDGASSLLTQIGQDKAILELQLRTEKGHKRKQTYYKSQLPKYQMALERTLFKASQIADDTRDLVKHLDASERSDKVLSELRGIQKPMKGMDDLMAGIIMVLKSPSADLSWQRGAKRQLANLERFIDELNTFKEIELNESNIKLLESKF